jgi:hypothetical protein
MSVRTLTMDESSTGGDDGTLLDIFGQQILPMYTQICFGFRITDAGSYAHEIESLEAALKKINIQFLG